jgi:ribonuclease HI
VVAYSSR